MTESKPLILRISRACFDEGTVHHQFNFWFLIPGYVAGGKEDTYLARKVFFNLVAEAHVRSLIDNKTILFKVRREVENQIRIISYLFVEGPEM